MEPEEAEESIEDRIKRLEAELEVDDETEEDEESDDEADDDAIEPLPAHQLPAAASKRKLKQHRAESGADPAQLTGMFG